MAAAKNRSGSRQLRPAVVAGAVLAVHLSAAARHRLKLDQTRRLYDENGDPYTYSTRSFDTGSYGGATTVWSSSHDEPGHAVPSERAITAVRALFEDDLGLGADDWHFDVRPAEHGRRPAAEKAQTFVSVDPVVDGRPVIQNEGGAVGGLVTVDSTGIRNLDLRLATLVRDGSTPMVTAAEAWDRVKHHSGLEDEEYVADEEYPVATRDAFTRATPGVEVRPDRDGRGAFSVPTWTFTDTGGRWITVSAESR
ncbi:MAG TPA: hypothetical protein VKB14_17235 [Actinomycetales bacterium]|nr:hypothetical protein [Actinomycetales bacterium]